MSDNHYGDILEALMGKVRTLTDYFQESFQVTTNRNDISRGKIYWLLCTPGAFLRTRLDGQDVIYNWSTNCDLFVRYKTEKESIPNLMAVRSVIVNTLHAPRAIRNLNVKSVTVTGEQIKQDMPPPAKPNFIIQPLLVTIEQIVKR